MGTKYIIILYLFMEIVNDIFDSITKCFLISDWISSLGQVPKF